MNSRRFIRSSSQLEDDGTHRITSRWSSHSVRGQMGRIPILLRRAADRWGHALCHANIASMIRDRLQRAAASHVLLEINARLITILRAAAGTPPRSGNPYILRSRNSRTGEPGFRSLIRRSLRNAQDLRVNGAAAHPKRSMSGVLGGHGGAPETYMWTWRSR